MIRNLILSAILATGTVAGLGLSNTAQAHEPVVGFDWGHRDRFEVLVRHRGHWDVVGVFDNRADARRVARQLERRGEDTKVRKVEFGRW